MNAEQEIRAKLGDFAADQDLMRDVYMTNSQRAAYQRILARALEQPEGREAVDVTGFGSPPLLHEERKDAEQAYTVTAFDYQKAPVGSRDWAIYWRGWWHRSLVYGDTTPPAKVPEGWRLVPVEATDEMIEAAWDSDAADYVGEHKRIYSLTLAWAAMLAAAPAPNKEANRG